MRTPVKFSFAMLLILLAAACNSRILPYVSTATGEIARLSTTPAFTQVPASPTASLTHIPYSTRTPNPTEQAWQQTPSPTTRAGYPTPAPVKFEWWAHIVGQQYVGNYVISQWVYPPGSFSFTSSPFYTISALGKPQEEIWPGMSGGWHLEDITNDGNPEIVFTIDTEARCCFGAVAYDVRREQKILDAYSSYCHGQFKDLDRDGIPEYLACDRASLYSQYCSEAGAPITQVILQYNKSDGTYQPASPKFSYLYDRELEQQNLALLEHGYDDLCTISYPVLNYLYSGRTDKAWVLASKYSGEDSPNKIKELALEAVTSSSWYVAPEDFRPYLLAMPDLPRIDDGGWLNLSFSPNDEMLALSHKGTIYVLDVKTGERVHELQTDEEYLWEIAFDPDSTTIAYLGESRNVTLWDLKTGKTRVIHNAKYMSFCLAFMPDGEKLAVCSYGEIIVIDIHLSTVAFKYEIAPDRLAQYNIRAPVLCHVALDPDGTTIAATVGMGGMTCDKSLLWDLKTRAMLGVNWSGSMILFNPAEDTFFTSDYGRPVEMFDANTGEWLSTITSRRGSVAVNPSGKTIIFFDGNKVDFIDIQSRDVLYTLDPDETVTDMELSHDGELLASLGEDGSLKLWGIP